MQAHGSMQRGQEVKYDMDVWMVYCERETVMEVKLLIFSERQMHTHMNVPLQ